jgi:hypothetical protein
VGGTTILVANAYATTGAVSCAVGATGVGSSGKAMAVADAEVSMGATVIGTGTTIAAGATSASATTAEGDVDG